MSKLLSVVLILLAATLAHGAAPRRLKLAEAEKLVREHIFAATPTMNPKMQFPLGERTPDEVWVRLGAQVFQVGGSGPRHYETFLLRGGRVTRLGVGCGGFGVGSMCVTDFDADKQPELVFAYSFGSGIHRTCLGLLRTHGAAEKAYELGLCLWHGDYLLRKVNDRTVKVLHARLDPAKWKAGRPGHTALVPTGDLATLSVDQPTARLRITLADGLDATLPKRQRVLLRPTPPIFGSAPSPRSAPRPSSRSD